MNLRHWLFLLFSVLVFNHTSEAMIISEYGWQVDCVDDFGGDYKKGIITTILSPSGATHYKTPDDSRHFQQPSVQATPLVPLNGKQMVSASMFALFLNFMTVPITCRTLTFAIDYSFPRLK